MLINASFQYLLCLRFAEINIQLFTIFDNFICTVMQTDTFLIKEPICLAPIEFFRCRFFQGLLRSVSHVELARNDRSSRKAVAGIAIPCRRAVAPRCGMRGQPSARTGKRKIGRFRFSPPIWRHGALPWPWPQAFSPGPFWRQLSSG